MLEFKNVSCSYEKPILEKINFTLKHNQILSILGANGSGKSTLLKALIGLMPYGGEIIFEGLNTQYLSLKQRAAAFAFAPQSVNIPFEFSVLDIVLAGRFHASAFGLNYSAKEIETAKEALEKMGVLRFENRIYSHLSGGERQLVLLARALAQQSKIIVMDEPITGLDLGNQLKMLDMMTQLKSDGYTIIQTTHYPDHALRVSDKVVWLHKGGVLAEGTPKDVINKERIREVYGIQSEFYSHKSGLDFLLPLNFTKKDFV
jgi:iron complex transport system ATP-binding protein